MVNVEKYYKYAQDILNNNNLVKIYKDLAKLFKNSGMYLEYTGISNALYNLTNDVNLWYEMGDTVKANLMDSNFALTLYNTYLKLTNPTFFDSYKDVIKNFGVLLKDAELINKKDTLSCDFENIINRYNAILYILIFLAHTSAYDRIPDFIATSKEMETIVTDFKEKNNPQNISPLENMNDTKIHLSSLISKSDLDTTINEFAVYLNPKNEEAYLNIIIQHLSKGATRNALAFYNNIYTKAFPNNPKIQRQVDLYWFISDKLYASQHYYEALIFQKKAIDIDLAKAGV